MTRLTRRNLLAGGAALAALAPASAYAQLDAAMGRGFVNAADFGLVSNNGSDPGSFDQTDKLREAVDGAAAAGLPLFIPGGTYAVQSVTLPSAITITGVRGATRIVSIAPSPVFDAFAANNVTLRDLVIDGAGTGGNDDSQGLLNFGNCVDIELDGLQLSNGAYAAVVAVASSGRITNVIASGFGTGIFTLDCHSLEITSNRISDCEDAGIRVWSSEGAGRDDGTLVANNEIFNIRSVSGGNGQNGNGINIFRSNGVRVTGNRIKTCEFSAIRLNETSDTIVSSNSCLDSGEVAIFSEFGFSGSVISNNVIDGAAQGISMTNFDSGGRLATCSGNVVRNIAPASRSNPDTSPVGIFAEADAVIANNVVDSVPGLGIGAGWGPYLRNVTITGNMVRDVEVGIAVSVADGAGQAVVAGNQISEARRAAIAGTTWTEIASDDLARDAAKFPNVTIGGNSVG